MINDFNKYSIMEEKFKTLFNLIVNELTNLGNNFESLHFSSKEIKNFNPKNEGEVNTLKKAKEKIIDKLGNFDNVFNEIKSKYNDLLEEIIETKSKFKMSNPNSNKFDVLIESNQSMFIDFQQKKSQAIEEIRENINLETDNKNIEDEIKNIKTNVDMNIKDVITMCKLNDSKIKKTSSDVNNLLLKFAQFSETFKNYENKKFNPNYDQLKIELMKKFDREIKKRDEQILELTKYINSIVKY